MAKLYDLGVPHFTVAHQKGFGTVDVEIANSVLSLKWEQQYYFPISLCKSLADLGGVGSSDQNGPDPDWEIPKRWKKLRAWDSYRWYNRPAK
ncbi:MAG: hypothetical protein AAF206_22960 [Bacteroidota bacterium]